MSIGIIDQYIAASGGSPILRDPSTGRRIKADTPIPIKA